MVFHHAARQTGIRFLVGDEDVPLDIEKDYVAVNHNDIVYLDDNMDEFEFDDEVIEDGDYWIFDVYIKK